MSKTKDGGILEMWFTESNLSDVGANDKLNIMMKNFFMRITNGDTSHEGITNSKVNTVDPVAKQRGSQLIILDVSKLSLKDD